VIRSGKTEFLPSITPAVVDDILAKSSYAEDELRPVIADLQPTSLITVPMLTKRRVVGAMQFLSAESGRRYGPEDVALAEAAAGRLAEALDSAWAADQHRQIAVTLQRALLPPRLPQIPGVEIAARYWPAVTEVGGDFYDVFSVDDQCWAVVIGDACGTGPNAAALTSIARHMVRAAARHKSTHDEVVEWLNDAILHSDRDLFCTACYTTMQREDGIWRFRSMSAGHPLPIVATASGTAAVGRAGTLLGVFDAVRTRLGEVDLAPGDVVVLYTDGVTDLPPPHDYTVDDMLQLVGSLRDRGSAAEIADAIHASVLERVPERHRQDDIALVVLRVDDA
jgi:serine phosphatase RsbU (regulator of sigma subunit)